MSSAERMSLPIRPVKEKDLISAAENGDLDVIETWNTWYRTELVDTIKDENGDNLLMSACWYGHMDIVEYLVISCKADVNGRNEDGDTPLHFACWNGHLPIVQFLVAVCGMDVNVRDGQGCTPLHDASGCWHSHIVEFLSDEHHADVTLQNDNGDTALLLACFSGDPVIVDRLSSRCAKTIGLPNKDGTTPMHYACSQGWLDVVKLLVETHKAAVNVQDNEGNTPLHDACRWCREDVATYLVHSCKACTTTKNSQGQTPLEYAEEMDRAIIIQHRCLPVPLVPPKEQVRDTHVVDTFSTTKAAHPLGNINQDRLQALENDSFADLVFLVGEPEEQQAIKANRFMLLAAVPSIPAMIDAGTRIQRQDQTAPNSTNNGSEDSDISFVSCLGANSSNTSTNTINLTTILLPDLHPTHVRYIIRYIYSGDVTFLNGDDMSKADDLRDMIKTANRFGCWKLKLIIEAQLINKHLTGASMIDLLLLAREHECVMLKDAGIRMAAKNVDELFGHPECGRLIACTELMTEVHVMRKGDVPSDGTVNDEFSKMSVMELYESLDGKDNVKVEAYMDRPSLLELVRSAAAETPAETPADTPTEMDTEESK